MTPACYLPICFGFRSQTRFAICVAEIQPRPRGQTLLPVWVWWRCAQARILLCPFQRTNSCFVNEGYQTGLIILGESTWLCVIGEDIADKGNFVGKRMPRGIPLQIASGFRCTAQTTGNTHWPPGARFYWHCLALFLTMISIYIHYKL